MHHARALGVLAVVLSLTYSGCSLMNLDDLDAPECASNSDCAEAQARAGLDPSLCGHCVDKLCDFQHREETCNGADDDCDGLIDEDVTVEGPRLTRVETPTGPVAFATAVDGPATTFVALARKSDAWGFEVFEDGEIGPRTNLRYRSGADGSNSCPYLNMKGSVRAQLCGFSDVALAVDATYVVYAAINTLGCAAGQLRVGLAEREADPFEVWLGVPDASDPANLALGVDIDPRNCWSGKSSVTSGARSPAIASVDLGPHRAGALAVWLGAGASDQPQADASLAVPVQALGVFQVAGDSSLFGTDEGAPVSLGSTTSLESPAVVALKGDHGQGSFVVGFASTDDDGIRGVRLMEVKSRDRRINAATLAFIPDDHVEKVVLAVGAAVESEVLEVGVLWSAPSEAPSALLFTTLSRIRSAPSSTPLRIETSRLLQAPQLLFRSAGFASRAPEGGWLAFWAQEGARSADVKLARLVDGLSEPLNMVTLSSGTIGFPLLLPSGDAEIKEAQLLGDDDEQEPIEVIAGWCGDRG